MLPQQPHLLVDEVACGWRQRHVQGQEVTQLQGGLEGHQSHANGTGLRREEGDEMCGGEVGGSGTGQQLVWKHGKLCMNYGFMALLFRHQWMDASREEYRK